MRLARRLIFLLLITLLAAGAWGLDPRQPLSAYGRQVWTTENGLPQNTVRAVLQTPDGFLWLGTEDGLARFDGVDFRVYSPETIPDLPSGIIEGLTLGGDGSLRVRTAGGTVTYRGGRFQPESSPQHPQLDRALLYGGDDVTAQLTARDGRVWIATATSLRVDTAVLKLPEDLGTVRVLFEDREGAVWAGCDRSLARIIAGQVDVLRSGSAMLAISEDREGDLWVGTEADGLLQLHEQRFASFGTTSGLRGVARAVLQDIHGEVWVGTDGGGLSRRTARGFETIPGLSSGVVLALASAPNGDIWAGTPTGLNRIHGGKAQVLTAADGLADDFIRSVLVDRHGAVWVGTRHGLTRIDDAGAMTTFTAMDGLGSDFVGAMIEARNGDLWIGTAGGLTKFNASRPGTPRFTTIALQGGLAKNVVTAMVEAGDGTIWLGSNGGGLSRLRDGTIVPVRAENLPVSISSVLDDRRGHLWIGSRRGVVRVAERALNDAIAHPAAGVAFDTGVALDTYDTADGMESRECSAGGHPAAVRATDGTLWFATLRGVSAVDPARLHENAVAPLVAVEQVLVNDRPAENLAERTIAPGQRRVEFAYAGLSFVAPGKVVYRYRLQGFDKEWVQAGGRRRAFYANLRPGLYTFQVMAANNDGLWSEPSAGVRLRIKPFFRETVWFYLLLLLLGLAAACLVYVLRVRRVEARYAGVIEERGRIAREIHDGLAQGIVSISLQLEVVGRLMGTSIESARTQLDTAKGMVRESLAEARSAIWELREDTGELPLRMGAMVQRIAGAKGRLEVTGTYRPLEASVEEELLKIAGEAVTNAIRHSGGTTVVVRLLYEVKRLELSVRDDGRGFQPDRIGVERFGVRGMRERAVKIGAVMGVESGDHGTKVTTELMLH